MKRNMDRRTFLKMAGSAVLVGVLAGCGDAGGGEVYDVFAVDFGESRSAVEFPECHSRVAGLAVKGGFVFDGDNRTVLIYCPNVSAQNRLGHIHTLR